MSLPGVEISARPLHFIWIVDCSGSMAGEKIQSLNTAIREAIPEMQRVAQSNPHAQVLVRAIKFSTGAQWHIAQPTPIENFRWRDLSAGGARDIGKALSMVVDQLKMPPMPDRGLPPMLVLITDGYPTDDVSRGLKALMDQPWGKKAVRVGIGIGADADYDMLQRFIGNPEIKALQANNADALVQYIKWASTKVQKSTSLPRILTSNSAKEKTNMSLPGGEIAARPLHFFWIADCSGSMAGEKIQSLNTAIREAIPEMQRVAQSNPHAQVLVRAIKFSSGATWHISQPTPVEKFQWQDLSAGGVTDMGRAFLLLTDQLKMPPMEQRGLPPVLVLITDGRPTDDVALGLKAIMDQPWGKKAIRIGIGIGADADYAMLQRFIGNPEIKALQANNADALVQYIKWASTVAVQAASAPNVQSNPAQNSPNPLPNIPAPPPDVGNQSSQDVW